MNHQELVALDHQFTMQTYGRFDVDIDRGKGATLWDLEGKEDIDFTSGIGVCSIGYGNPKWVDVLLPALCQAGPYPVRAHRHGGGLFCQLRGRVQRGDHQAGPEVLL